MRCDPAIAAELERAFGPNDWRYPHTLARIAPRRAAAWARRAAAGAKLRGQWWHVGRPACMCFRVQLEASRRLKPPTGKQWRGGGALCTLCTQVVAAAAAGGLTQSS